MAVTASFNNKNFSIPENGNRNWGTPTTNFLLEVAAAALSKAGGNFTLTADANFGANFGLVAKYLKSVSSNPALAGTVRLSNTDVIAFRNAANDGDLTLGVSPANKLLFGGSEIAAAGDVTTLAGRVTTAESNIGALQTEVQPLNRGGTGQTTAAAARNALLPDQTGNAGKVLETDGVNVSWEEAGGSGSGEINLILSPNSATDWTGTATAATDLTPANFPLQGAIESALKISSGTAGQYLEYPFVVPTALALKLKLELWFKHSGSATDWKVELYKAGVEVPLKSDVAGESYIPAGTGRWATDHDFEAASYSLRIVRTASVAMDLYVQAAVVGPGTLGFSARRGPRIPFTPTFGNVTVANNGSWWQSDGEDAIISVDVSATADATGVVFFNPSSTGISGVGVDPVNYLLLGARQSVGAGTFLGGTNNFLVGPRYTGSTNQFSFVINGASALGNTDPTGEGGMDTNDRLTFEIRVPIAAWAGSTLNVGAGANVEYASFTGTVDADNTSAGTANNFNGAGTAMSALTTERYKYVKWITPPQNGDVIEAQVSLDSGRSWSSSSYGYVYNSNATLSTGVRYAITDANGVSRFDIGRYAEGALGWSSAYTIRFRKFNPQSPVGFGPSSATDRGLVSGNEGIPGNNTGSPVPQYKIGERVSVNDTENFTTSPSAVLQITLTTGRWDLKGYSKADSASGYTALTAGISTTTSFDADYIDYKGPLNGLTVLNVWREVDVTAASQTFYLIGQSAGSNISGTASRNRLSGTRVG